MTCMCKDVGHGDGMSTACPPARAVARPGRDGAKVAGLGSSGPHATVNGTTPAGPLGGMDVLPSGRRVLTGAHGGAVDHRAWLRRSMVSATSTRSPAPAWPRRPKRLCAVGHRPWRPDRSTHRQPSTSQRSANPVWPGSPALPGRIRLDSPRTTAIHPPRAPPRSRIASSPPNRQARLSTPPSRWPGRRSQLRSARRRRRTPGRCRAPG